MNIVIPMAGRGSRLRPHTLTVPKPLVKVAGKSIVQRLVEDIAAICDETIDEIAFIIGDFGEQVEKDLVAIAERLGATGKIYYQDQPLGTAHAIMCAEPALRGNVIVAFADTLFRADFKLDGSADGIIWVNQVDNPSAFGVVKLDGEGIITDFVEKPDEFVSDLAIIGIYYFKDGENLRNELAYLLDNDIREKGEYQLTNALENMKQKGKRFATGSVIEWLDCGNKNATVYTNQRVLANTQGKNGSHAPEVLESGVVVEPCYIGKNVKIVNSVVGPYVSLGDNCVIENSVLKNSIVQHDSRINGKVFENSMVGSNASVSKAPEDLSVGDFTNIQ